LAKNAICRRAQFFVPLPRAAERLATTGHHEPRLSGGDKRAFFCARDLEAENLHYAASLAWMR
jgi:hypothetical protein